MSNLLCVVEGGEGGNNPITTLIKVQKIQKGQKVPYNGNAILPKIFKWHHSALKA
jgi:hypothetical protein